MKPAKKTSYVIDGTPLRIRDMPETLRPREELERRGVENVGDDVLLAIILRFGVRGVNVVSLAKGLIQEYGSLTELAKASIEELGSKKGIGKVKAQIIASSLELAKRLSREEMPKRYSIKSPEDAARLLREQARTLDTEVFWSLMLDSKNRLKGNPVEISRGTIDASLVHAREVFRKAVQVATVAVVLAHNHPSGDCVPSAEDIRITKQLVEAGRVMDIKVLDHVIIGRPQKDGGKYFISMREEGIVNFG